MINNYVLNPNLAVGNYGQNCHSLRALRLKYAIFSWISLAFFFSIKIAKPASYMLNVFMNEFHISFD